MKLRRQIAVVATAGALATGLLTPNVQASDPPRDPKPVDQTSRGDRFERLHLACAKTDRNTVRCEWRAPNGSNAVKVVLYGSVNNGGRIVLKTLRPPAAGTYTRTIPRRARQLEFVLVTFNSAGQVVGRSDVVTISV